MGALRAESGIFEDQVQHERLNARLRYPEKIALADLATGQVVAALARISHTLRASRQRNSTDTRRAPNLAACGIDIRRDAEIKRNAVAVEFRKDSPKVYEKCGLDDHPGSDRLIGLLIDEDEAAGDAVVAVGVVE